MPKLGENAPIVENNTHEEEQHLKGTFALSLMLGGLIVVSWVAAFLFYLSRS